jgi:hypothetical protein
VTSIIAASLYRNGKRVGPVSLDQPVRCATDRSEFVWIGLFEPSEAEFIVQRRTSLRQCNVSVSGQRELKDGAAERIGARP